MILALIGTLALCGGALAGQEDSPAVALEWSVRGWALDPGGRAAEIERAARDADWKRRHGAFDALARSAPGSITAEQERLARAALADEHPNVRAQALAALAAHGADVGEFAPSLAVDPFPEVRRELARALARLPDGEADRTLLELTADVDPRVAREALDQLLPRFLESREMQRELWRRGTFHRDAEAYLHALDVLDRSHGRRPAYGEMAGSFGHLSGVELSEAQRSAYEVLWNSESFGMYLYETGSLVVGWRQALGSEHSPVERKRRARLLETAETAGREVGKALLYAASKEDAKVRAGVDDAVEASERASFFLAGAVSALTGPDFWGDFARQGHSGPRPRDWSPDPDWSDDFAIEFWDAVIGRAESWEPEDAVWLEPDVDTEVSAAAIDAFADTWMRTRDVTSGELLVIALADPLHDLAYDAWLAFARTEDGVILFRRQLYKWWSKQPIEVKLEALREVTREVPLDTPWREELVRLWAGGEGRTVSVIELLGAHLGDEDVETLLWSWLARAIDVLEASPVPDEKTTRGPWREAETMALWLTRAWLRVTGPEELRRRVELLERVGQLGKELGKILITDLAKSSEGRAALKMLLESPELSRRLRIEIVLVDETVETSAAFDLLLERYGECDEELRLRIGKRLADLDEPRSRELLLSVALDGDAGLGERGVAIDSLAEAGTPAEVEPLLLRVIDDGGNLDLKRAAIGALGSVGGETTERRLYGFLADPDQAQYLRDVILPTLAHVEVRRGSAPSPRLVGVLIEEARGRADEELELRFRGERLSSRAFAYSGLIGALATFTRAGVLEEALELAGPWWCFDARLLLELGATVTESGGAAADGLTRRLNLAALIGLVGEGDAPDRQGLIAKARARLLRIARRARAWREAEGWASTLLEDWRSGRTTRSGFEAAFGARDVEAKRDPTEWLLACQLQARAWRALEAGEVDEARSLASRALRWPNISRLARKQQDELEAALD